MKWTDPGADPVEDIRTAIAGLIFAQPPMSFLMPRRRYLGFRYVVGRLAIGKAPTKRSRRRFMGRAGA